MTCIGQKPVARTGITIACNDTVISDNQIYVRGNMDPLVTGIKLNEPAVNAIVHDNIIRNCGAGFITGRAESRVGEVVDNRAFLRLDGPTGLPLERIRPENVKGWSLIWRSGKESEPYAGISVIESFDPETLRFRLTSPQPMKPNDRFEVSIPSLNWTVHHNTITGCQKPVTLNSYGSKTCLFRDNLVSRGNVSNVPVGMEIHGCFQLVDNNFVDFDEETAVAVSIYPDAIGRTCSNQYQGNTFENCCEILRESKPGLLKAAVVRNNNAIDCIGKLPKQNS
jgi:hypothetical protein